MIVRDSRLPTSYMSSVRPSHRLYTPKFRTPSAGPEAACVVQHPRFAPDVCRVPVHSACWLLGRTNPSCSSSSPLYIERTSSPRHHHDVCHSQPRRLAKSGQHSNTARAVARRGRVSSIRSMVLCARTGFSGCPSGSWDKVCTHASPAQPSPALRLRQRWRLGVEGRRAESGLAIPNSQRV